MLLRIPNEQLERLRTALRRAGRNEIGGQLFGEQIAPSAFRVKELTIQRRRGTFARFVVDLYQAARDAAGFFDRTGHQYTQYNYLGEWHSHPSFAVRPSDVDIRSMHDLVRTPDFKGNFAVLMITKLQGEQVELGGWVFDRSNEHSIQILREDD